MTLIDNVLTQLEIAYIHGRPPYEGIVMHPEDFVHAVHEYQPSGLVMLALGPASWKYTIWGLDVALSNYVERGTFRLTTKPFGFVQGSSARDTSK